jgi:hypothetical protein
LVPLHNQKTSVATPGDAPAAPSPNMADYEARRCVVCNSRYPSFGFGPPLSHTGSTLWACFVHKNDVDKQLSAARAPTPETDFSHASEGRVTRPSSGDRAALGDARQASLF